MNTSRASRLTRIATLGVLLAGLSAPAFAFQVEETSIASIQAAIQDGSTTCQQVAQAYINRAKAYNGICTALVTADGKPVPSMLGTVRAGSPLKFPTETVAVSKLLPNLDKYKGIPLEYGRMEPTASDPKVVQQYGMIVGLPDAGQLNALGTLNIRGERSVTCQGAFDAPPGKPLPANAPVNRLTFAKWIVARDAPTTARSLVNRLWQAYFGIGIVETAEDFGSQSSPPSHPELLDWLAVEFMDRNWDIKAIQRLIVTSSTYRQNSKVDPELLSKDPYNRLLARGPRFRVDGEIVRDIALSASGLLTDKVGGPSVFPPAPGFLFLPPTSYGPKTWDESKGEDKYRRALYTFRFRSVPYPMLQTFDSPTGDSSCVRRSRSNTPLQALTTLNEPLFIEAARALAAKVMKDGGDTDASRLNYAMRRVLSRGPSADEAGELLRLLNKEQSRFGDGRHDPKLLAGVDSAQTAAWTVVSRVLLNLDETITKE